MTRSDRKLLRELAAVIVLKLLVLTALWFAFFHHQTVRADAASTAAAVVDTPVPASRGVVHGQ